MLKIVNQYTMYHDINIYLLKYVIQNNNYVSFLTQILPLLMHIYLESKD